MLSVNLGSGIRHIAAGLAVLLLSVPAIAAGPRCPTDLPMHLALPAMRGAIAHDRPVTIVALGSSSTEGAGASAPDRTYPARLAVQIHVSLPESHVTVLNRGVGGQLVNSVLARVNSDVIAVKPTVVIWQIGTNEAMRAMDPAQFESMLDTGLTRIAATGADIVLMDYQLAPKMPTEEESAVYGAIIARQARAHGVSLFSRTALMRSWAATEPNARDMIGTDGLHHSDRGYACLAGSLDSAIVAAVAPPVSAVSVNLK